MRGRRRASRPAWSRQCWRLRSGSFSQTRPDKRRGTAGSSNSSRANAASRRPAPSSRANSSWCPPPGRRPSTYARLGRAPRARHHRRYILRDLATRPSACCSCPNTELKPERGATSTSDQLGDVQRRRLAQVLPQRLSGLHPPAFASPLFVPQTPPRARAALAFFPFHGVLYVQRTTQARARIQGMRRLTRRGSSLRGRGR